jgi:two-component system, NtrC family, sensor kinase
MGNFYVIRGTDSGQRFAIRGPLTTIGRDSSNQIKLNDTEVSRQHALVVRNDESEFEIRDTGSSNGTFVNSRRIESKVLQGGDRVQIGGTLMVFTGGPDPHSTRSLEAVEIVVDRRPDQLAQIRSSLESNYSAPSSLSRVHETNADADADAESSLSVAGTFDDWELVYQVSQAINRTGDLDDLLVQVLDLIFQWIECDRGCVMMLDDVTGQLVPTYIRDRKRRDPSHTSAKSPKLLISRTILDHVMKTKEGVLTSNAQTDARWQDVESISSLGVNEAICVPMLGRYGLVGAIYIHTQVSAGVHAERQGKFSFDEAHLKLMIAIAGQAALAIEDTQFYRAMLQSERLAAMGQTIANLSHHVKNILQGVSGGSYLVEDGLKKADLDVVQRGWNIVLKNQDRIGNLVMDMLSFSKEREPELTRGDVQKLIADVVELMSLRATEAGVRLVHQTSATPLIALFDADAMHRALLNIVTNAIDAAAACDSEQKADPQVTIQAEIMIDRKNVCIRVVDSGDGIAPKDLQRIFSPFESSKGSRGTGLGLPVSQKILREHGGDVTVKSEIKLGTTFKLFWPHGIASDPGPVNLQGTVTQ